MKKTILVYGLIAGAILSLLMFVTLPFHDRMGMDAALVVGYTSMVLAFMLVFFGIRSYRDQVNGGAISFGRAFAVGGLIMLVASLCYVASWQVIYYNFMPDYAERYADQVIEQARADGESEAELAERRASMANWAELYRNPLYNAGLTLLEPLPVGLVMTLVSAGILRRRRTAADSGGRDRPSALPVG